MTEELIIRPLKCGHCGKELPVMGQLVTFQCPACFCYWMISHDALEPISVQRAVPRDDGSPAGTASDRIYLPFWVADIDGAGLRQEIAHAVKELQGTTQAILRTEFEAENRPPAGEKSPLDMLVPHDPPNTAVMARARFMSEASSVKKVPASSEINYLLGRLESLGILRIYIPAFRSLNTYAYLKVGRLLTRLQPSFALERSEGTGHPILCALRVEEAVALMDFIFFATLPESIQSNGDFLEKIRLKPARPPRLVEFPFQVRGTSLVSMIGGFWISGRLVEGVDSLVE